MPRISVAKALKLKNRLAGRLSETQNNIIQNNSTLAEQRDQVDVAALLKERDQLSEALIGLKTQIIVANAEIQSDIIRKGELASTAEWIKTVPHTDGPMRHGYQNTEVKYVAVLKKSEIDKRVRELEKQIDAIQDRLDEFNHTQRIEVPQAWLDLGA